MTISTTDLKIEYFFGENIYLNKTTGMFFCASNEELTSYELNDLRLKIKKSLTSKERDCYQNYYDETI